jgi:hypothetical protein
MVHSRGIKRARNFERFTRSDEIDAKKRLQGQSKD